MTTTTMTTGNEVDFDGNGVTGNEVDFDGDGAMDDDNKDDDDGGGNGVMGSGATGYDVMTIFTGDDDDKTMAQR